MNTKQHFILSDNPRTFQIQLNECLEDGYLVVSGTLMVSETICWVLCYKSDSTSSGGTKLVPLNESKGATA